MRSVWFILDLWSIKMKQIDKMALKSQPKSTDIFLISPRKHMLWYSLEAPRGGASNEYSQHMFSCRNKKNIIWIAILLT